MAEANDPLMGQKASSFRATSYFPPLDGLRTLSVLLVITNHLPHPPVLEGWVFGWVGVHVFFVISGFLITTLLLREEERSGQISVRAFYIRRVFRILPIYYIALLVYLAICALPVFVEKWNDLMVGLPYYLSFFQEYVPAAAGTVFGHSWSLGVEEKFYLIWPVLFFLLFRVPRRRFAVLCCAIISLVGFGHSTNLCRSYAGIAAGCVLAIVMHAPRTARLRTTLARPPAFAVVTVLTTSYCLLAIAPEMVLVFQWVVAWTILHVLLRDSWLSRALGLPGMVWVGKRTYSMYLFHALCLNAVQLVVPVTNGWRFLLATVLGFALTILVSVPSYAWIEQPAIRLGKRFARSGRARAGSDSPEPT